MSAIGLGSEPSSVVGLCSLACATRVAGSPARPACSRGSPVSVSKRMAPTAKTSALRVARSSVRLLRRQGTATPLRAARLPCAAGCGQYPNPRSRTLALVGHQHAARRHQAVEVTPAGLALAAVRVLQRRADLARDQQGVVHRERESLLAAAREDGAQALALQELVGDVVRRVDLADPVDLEHVRVLELGRELDLVHQALDRLGVRRERGFRRRTLTIFSRPVSAELGRTVFVADADVLDLFQEDELPEFSSWPSRRSYLASQVGDKVPRCPARANKGRAA